MLEWRLSLGHAMPRRTVVAALWRRRVALAAGAAVVVTLALGWSLPQPPSPGIAPIALSAGLPMLAGLAAVAAVGLIAFQLARLTISPTPGLAQAGLPGALIAVVLLPGIGIAALGVPMLMSLLAARNAPEHRVVPLLVHCGAIFAAASTIVNHIGYLYFGTIVLVFAVFKCAARPAFAANDNPSLERIGWTFTGCWPPVAVVQEGLGRVWGSGEYLNVQQQQSWWSRRKADGPSGPTAPGER